jgi:hypothetical protein
MALRLIFSRHHSSSLPAGHGGPPGTWLAGSSTAWVDEPQLRDIWVGESALRFTACGDVPRQAVLPAPPEIRDWSQCMYERATSSIAQPAALVPPAAMTHPPATRPHGLQRSRTVLHQLRRPSTRRGTGATHRTCSILRPPAVRQAFQVALARLRPWPDPERTPLCPASTMPKTQIHS